MASLFTVSTYDMTGVSRNGHLFGLSRCHFCRSSFRRALTERLVFHKIHTLRNKVRLTVVTQSCVHLSGFMRLSTLWSARLGSSSWVPQVNSLRLKIYVDLYLPWRVCVRTIVYYSNTIVFNKKKLTFPMIQPMSSLGTVISCDCWLVADWLRDWFEVRSWDPARAAKAAGIHYVNC